MSISTPVIAGVLSFSKTAGEADADCFDDDDDGDMSVSQVPHVSRVDYIEKGKSAFVLFSGVDQALHTKKKKKEKKRKRNDFPSDES